MKKKKLRIINGNENLKKMKRAVLLIVCISLCMSVTGCVPVPMDRRRFMGKMSVDSEEQSEDMMQSIIETLEKQDAEALKKLFSLYTLEKAENLDEKIEELLEFYPGSEGEFEGHCVSSRGYNYGEINIMLNGTYTICNSGEEYEVNFVFYPRNDEEPEKIGLYLLEVMTEEAKQEGFKWRNEEDEPGVYVLEPQEL